MYGAAATEEVEPWDSGSVWCIASGVASMAGAACTGYAQEAGVLEAEPLDKSSLLLPRGVAPVTAAKLLQRPPSGEGASPRRAPPVCGPSARPPPPQGWRYTSESGGAYDIQPEGGWAGGSPARGGRSGSAPPERERPADAFEDVLQAAAAHREKAERTARRATSNER